MPEWLPPFRVPEPLWRILVLRSFTHRVRVSRHTIPLRGLSAALDGLRAVFIADPHCGPLVSSAFLRTAFRLAADLKPDLFLFGGDYIDREPSEFQLFRDLAQPILTSGKPVFGVLGNHDWWPEPGKPPRVHSAKPFMLETGVRLLDHTCVFMNADRRWSETPDSAPLLCLAGLGDDLEDIVNPEAALAGIPPGTPTVVLAHNPDAAGHPDIQAGRYRIDAMLCGHTHGGQCVFPLIGAPMLLIRHREYGRGVCQGPGFPILTSTGLGVSSLPIRLNCPPEIHEVTFTALNT